MKFNHSTPYRDRTIFTRKNGGDPVISNDRLIKDYSRRDFLKITGASLVTASLGSFMPGCATIDLKKDWSKVPVKDFDMEGFDAWYKRNKLYNGVNPNLILRHSGGYHGTFKANVFSRHGATPGIDYSVHSGEEMVAAAEGEFIRKMDLHFTGRAGGMMVTIAHPDARHGVFCTHYAHLGDLYVEYEEGKKIKRGQPIGGVPGEHTQWAKLLFSKGRPVQVVSGGNWTDPDNYGEKHSFMDYWDGRDLEIKDMKGRLNKQRKVFKAFQNAIVDRYKGHLATVQKNTYREYENSEGFRDYTYWDIVEHFRYLEELYKINPNLFPSISRDHYTAIKCRKPHSGAMKE